MAFAARRWRAHAGAALLFAMISIGWLDHGASLTKTYLGLGSDPLAFVWLLSWWPWALLHHVNPLASPLVWQPEGFDLAWTPSVPALALLMLPVTQCFGAVLSYNLLTLAAPALAAFGAYTLCFYLTRRTVPAIIGGIAYGFSTFQMSESLEHLDLDFTCAVPCLLLIVLARLDGRFGRGTAVLLFSVALALQFYISMEVAATALLFGGIAWCYAMLLLPDRRAVLKRLFWDGLIAGGLTFILLLPFLWHMAAVPRQIFIPAGWSYTTTARLFNMVVTTPAIVFVNPNLPYNPKGFFGLIPQYDVTTGLGLVLICAAYFITHSGSRVVLYSLITILLASLGPQLWVGPRFTGLVMPWAVMLHVPLLSSALPVRFEIFSSLIFAMVLALWTAESRGPVWPRAGLAACAWALTMGPPHPATPVPNDEFFQPGRVQAVLGAQARVLILPSPTGDLSSFWQAENHFGFIQSQGYLGMPPRVALGFPAVRDMIVNKTNKNLGAEIASFCWATKTQYVLAGPGAAAPVVGQVASLGWPSRQVGDVQIFTVPAHG